jgi:hypothetical protein
LRALNGQTGAPRFDEALSTLLQRNLKHCFECSRRIALIYRNRSLCAVQWRLQKSANFHLHYLKFNSCAHAILQSDADAARSSASGTLIVRQIKREAFALQSCSTKRPDRDEDLMKMRRARKALSKGSRTSARR